ncbi:PD40 domain-containing protein [Pyxidicoccus parkwayensis]|uniref:PD40 domain-containing protein n=2 Tax=Pyxidicoccus parkwayensis TaxID=2813578 RepID=A0ABX7NM82_9BACT|nr:PD40 domain-containing protein [Pyxidicoccus parkwaysis]
MHPTEVRSRFSRGAVALWMASSLALAGCGGAEASGSAEPYATESQGLDTSGDASLDADRRIIVYQTQSLQLYWVDSKGRSQLVAQRTGKPMISPDGKQVAYAKLPDNYRAGDPVTHADLYVLDGSSGHSSQVTRGYDDTEPVWAPDSRNLLFQSTTRSRVPSLWKVRDNGSGLAQVTNVSLGRTTTTLVPNPLSSEDVEWDFDRRIIVYSTTSLTNGDVRVISFDRSLNAMAAYSIGSGYGATWTQPGTVAFSRDEDGQTLTMEVHVY